MLERKASIPEQRPYEIVKAIRRARILLSVITSLALVAIYEMTWRT